MYELITDPLILPGNDMVIDRKVIERHLLSDETNPFTRETLTFELLKEYNEKPEIHEKLEQLKLRIAEFI
jgi:ubiquitin conjugation factor E4 B